MNQRQSNDQDDEPRVIPDQDEDDSTKSSDSQGLSPSADASDESVESLADAGQDVEAEFVKGVEDAADHPERPVPDHEVDKRPPGPEKERTTL
jgi:hypothetical protein